MDTEVSLTALEAELKPTEVDKATVVEAAKQAEHMDVALVQTLVLNSIIEANHRFRGSPRFSSEDTQVYYRMLKYLLRDMQPVTHYAPNNGPRRRPQ